MSSRILVLLLLLLVVCLSWDNRLAYASSNWKKELKHREKYNLEMRQKHNWPSRSEWKKYYKHKSFPSIYEDWKKRAEQPKAVHPPPRD